jgi:hypothetical protein
MKKYPILLFTLILFCLSVFSQNEIPKNDDFSAIVLNVYVPINGKIPEEANGLLESKLRQIASANGLGGTNYSNPRFVLTATVHQLTSEQISESLLYYINAEIVYYVVDAAENKIFNTLSVNYKGVGNTESKAFIDIFKKIQVKTKDLEGFLNRSKEKIIQSYNDQCDFILKEAAALDKQGLFDEAIAKLMLVPDVCKECYFKCTDQVEVIYQHKIDKECTVKIREAKAKWASTQTREGAEAVAEIISSISPFSICEPETGILLKSIQEKLTEEDKKNWDFKMKIYNDAIELKKLAINLVQQENNRQYELDKLKIQSDMKARIYAYKRRSIANDIAKQLYLMKSQINYSNIKIN